MLKVVIFTQNTMASTVATRELIRVNHRHIAAIVVASPLRGDSLWTQAKLAYKMIRKSSVSFACYKFIESGGYNALLLIHKLIRSKKYSAGTAMSITDLAARYNIPLIRTGDLSDGHFLHQIKRLNPDFVFCVVGQILKKIVFETLGEKLLNTHGSYLPQYRGAAQYFWYLLDRHSQFGVTLHYMNAGLDTGNIILQKRFDFDRTISAYKLHYLLGEQFGKLFNEFLVRFGNGGHVPTIEQRNDEATFTRMPTSEDVRQFRSDGHHWVTVADFLSST